MNHERHHIPKVELKRDMETSSLIGISDFACYQTYASLGNIRKIYASTGADGRFRCSDRITGLKFEYYDHPCPSVVGQWMKELDGGFEMSPDEKIQLLNIWDIGSYGIFSSQVMAIRIETTHSRSVTFYSPECDSPDQLSSLQSQYQTDNEEGLTGISWVFSLECDRIRAVVPKSESPKAQILVPDYGPLFDDYQMFYFQTQKADEDGSRETMVSVEAYFLDRQIIGFVFIYSSGRSAKAGFFDDATSRQTVHFSWNDRIIGIATTTIDRQLREFEFEVVQNERHHYTKKLTHFNVPPDGTDTRAVDRLFRNVWCKDTATARSYNLASYYQQYDPWTSSGEVYRPPNGSRLVGIYFRCLGYKIGAIYEPDDEVGRERSPESISGRSLRLRYRVVNLDIEDE